ncbi:hypothetical protein [McMurdo Ice Shelf pond-associated circular DNA virus-8]|uniref:hypothetical protein n=1 Tax=McMurdo Ice Shelf pond-associated circular DNA virus-8 TaxID=1521392 RepID=UPI0004D0E02B|nr:hypothetical protein [McMurdo Ice Shelf pond-associated circular DNA virus-8]AIF71520.1 hypothetical protein [McMurdo Ice Shelf pond-associated circular DNA virus-8]
MRAITALAKPSLQRAHPAIGTAPTASVTGHYELKHSQQRAQAPLPPLPSVESADLSDNDDFEVVPKERASERSASAVAASQYGGTKRRRGQSTSKGSSPYLMRPITMADSRLHGGKVTRTYKVYNTYSTTLGTSSTAFFGASVSNSAAGGAQALKLFLGRALTGVGTLGATFLDFPEECKNFNNCFKWMTVDAFQMRVVPFSDAIVVDANNAAVTSQTNNCGLIFCGSHTGNPDSYAPATGLSTIDLTNIERRAHKTVVPVGKRDGIICCEPHTAVLIDNQYGQDLIEYPRLPAINTAIMMASATEYPFYGSWIWWSHPGTSAVQAKFTVGLEFTIKISWNTVQDANIVAMEAKRAAVTQEAQRAALAGQPNAFQCPGQPEVAPYPVDPFSTDDLTAVKKLRVVIPSV